MIGRLKSGHNMPNSLMQLHWNQDDHIFTGNRVYPKKNDIYRNHSGPLLVETYRPLVVRRKHFLSLNHKVKRAYSVDLENAVSWLFEENKPEKEEDNGENGE